MYNFSPGNRFISIDFFLNYGWKLIFLLIEKIQMVDSWVLSVFLWFMVNGSLVLQYSLEDNYIIVLFMPTGHISITIYLLSYWLSCLPNVKSSESGVDMSNCSTKRPANVRSTVSLFEHLLRSLNYSAHQYLQPVLYRSVSARGEVYAGEQAEESIRGPGLRQCRPGTNDNSRSWTTSQLSTFFSPPSDTYSYTTRSLCWITKVRCGWIKMYAMNCRSELWIWLFECNVKQVR